MELARPDTSDAVSELLVSMPSVSTMIAFLVPERLASRRAVDAVASYKDVVPKGRKSMSALCRRGRSPVAHFELRHPPSDYSYH